MADWVEQLSTIKAPFQLCYSNYPSNLRTHFSERSLSIQLFCCPMQRQGSCLRFLKHRGDFTFPIIQNIDQLLPWAFAKAVSLTFGQQSLKQYSKFICIINISKCLIGQYRWKSRFDLWCGCLSCDSLTCDILNRYFELQLY